MNGILSELKPSLDSGVARLSKSDVEQSNNKMVAMIVPPSQQIHIKIILNRENKIACTAALTGKDTVDATVSSVEVNYGGRGSGDADNFQDTPRKMERVSYITESFSSFARVDDSSWSPTTHGNP